MLRPPNLIILIRGTRTIFSFYYKEHNQVKWHIEHRQTRGSEEYTYSLYNGTHYTIITYDDNSLNALHYPSLTASFSFLSKIKYSATLTKVNYC